MHPHDDPMPQPPDAPLPSDCCDSGCDPCIYDFHARELAEYRLRLAAWRLRHPLPVHDDLHGKAGS
jgi:hypothetical protein